MGGDADLGKGDTVGMILITMEAQVGPELEPRLIRAFNHAMNNHPPGVVQSLLTRDAQEPTIWRILTIWESREMLEAHYKSGAIMPSAHVFHLAELVPVGRSSEIIAMDVTMIVPPQHEQNDSMNDTMS
jgi:quinol monooxygenase YgiN